MKKGISTSLSVSTYNWPDALNLCLLSIKRQKTLPDEVIIADDGSKDDTRELIIRHQADFPVPLSHIWQPDEGFQLAQIRNKAIAAARYDYIIQIDGDLILHPQFIADHISFSREKSFVSGSRVMIGENLSKTLIDKQITNISIFSNDIKNKLNGLRSKLLRNCFFGSYKTDDIYYLRGCNMAFWRNDLIAVNGFNEDFTGWGREDNEIAARLMNAGIQKRTLKFGGVIFHVYHEEKSRSDTDRNQDLLNDVIRNKKTFGTKGINQYL